MAVIIMTQFQLRRPCPEYALAQLSRDRTSARCIGELEQRGLRTWCVKSR